MRWSDEIVLIAQAVPAPENATNENGFPVERAETRTEVFGNVKSVGYSEYWKAAQAGFQAELKAEVYTAEYDGQKIVEIGGKRYEVLRTYMPEKENGEVTELTLTDLPVVPEETAEAGSSAGAEGGGGNGTV